MLKIFLAKSPSSLSKIINILHIKQSNNRIKLFSKGNSKISNIHCNTICKNDIQQSMRVNKYFFSVNKQISNQVSDSNDKNFSHSDNSHQVNKNANSEQVTKKKQSLTKSNKKQCYYDWNDQNSFERAIKQKYFLRDIIDGFRVLKNKKIQYNDTHLQFMVYVCALFSQYEDEIMQEFIPTFIKNQQKPDYYKVVPSYIRLAKTLCTNFKRQPKHPKKHTQIILKYLKRRINHPENCKNLQIIQNSLYNNCYQYMGDLKEVFEVFKNLTYKQFSHYQYKVPNKILKTIVSTYQNLSIFDNKIKSYPFFSTIPDIYKKDQRIFKNLIQILPEILTFNFINFVSESDISQLNSQIAQCTSFKQKQTKLLLRRYSEHLVIVNRVQLINFQKVLDTI